MKRKPIPLLLTLLLLVGCSNPNIKGWNEGEAQEEQTTEITTQIISETTTEEASDPYLYHTYGKLGCFLPREWEKTEGEDCIEFKWSEHGLFARMTCDQVPLEAETPALMEEYIKAYKEDGMKLSGELKEYSNGEAEGFVLSGYVAASDGSSKFFRSENIRIKDRVYKIEASCNPEYSSTLIEILDAQVRVGN